MKTTDDLGVASTGGAAARFLLVTSEKGLRVHPLPASGELIIGRDQDCGVVIDHPKVSRRHARLNLGDGCTFTDLGSRNGTTFRGEPLVTNQPYAMTIGESFAIGPLSLMLLPAGAAFPRTTATESLRVEDPASATPSPLVQAIARSPVSVLIAGETGVGKEVLAATLHRLSGRKGPFLAVNCAAVSESLLESELFGHERGAFTGALQAKAGLLEAAAGGTVFLDEIGEMSAAVQAKLLRATEAREILRVGSVKPIAIDVRFVAATHRDLVRAGTFRKDLYYRLAAMTLVIPPLRERRERIGTIAVELLGARGTLSAAATARLQQHAWPGNVRELRNVIDRALLLAGGDGAEIGPEHLVFDAPTADAVAAPPVAGAAEDDADRARIIEALEACAGNQTHAARKLGISRATLVHKLAVHRIPRPRKR